MQRTTAILSGIILELMPPPPPQQQQGPPPPNPFQLHEMERQAAINRIWTESHLKGADDRSKHVIEIAVVTMRSVFLVNGASIVALLTFLGTGRGPLESVMLRIAFQHFGIGLVLALLAMGVAYVAQQMFSMSEYDKANAVYTAVIRNEPERPSGGQSATGLVCQIGAFCLAAGSLLFFILGAFASLDGLFPPT
ncbi:hypothetical protein [Terricaulis sp.]|uniref:hypothetical protein n=1 Tax=Terricaulis sp. TaxID=2768686 RepID=UPI00378438D3